MGCYIGISGWQYGGWRGEFYPDDLPHRRELEYASRVLNSIEINGTFYSLKSPASFEKWAAQTPDDFVFSVKGSRYITHTLRLRDVETALGNFFANGVLKLGKKLGPFLWQLPPHMKFEPDVVRTFCELLPKDAKDAARIAKGHDERVRDKMWFDVDRNFRLRHCFEVRDERLMNEQCIDILRENGHGFVIADTAGKFPFAEDITAGFVYVRLHGAEELYSSGYNEEQLDWWARRIRRWMKGEQMKTGSRISDRQPPRRKSRDVYVYFDNDVKVHAPFDALSLASKLNIEQDVHRLKGIDGDELPPPPRLQENRK